MLKHPSLFTAAAILPIGWSAQRQTSTADDVAGCRYRTLDQHTICALMPGILEHVFSQFASSQMQLGSSSNTVMNGLFSTASTRPLGDRTYDENDNLPPPSDSEKSSEILDGGEFHNPAQEEDIPPNGGYGWVCVICVFWINAHTWGLNSSYGIFLAHYLSANTFPETSYLDYAFVGGLSISQALLVSPIATIVTRKYGTRATLLSGVFLEMISLVGASFATRIWQLFLSQGICFGWGMGFLFVGSVGIIPQWFTTRRSIANGIATGGSGIGGMMYSLAANVIIQKHGLAWAFRILAILAFVVNLTCSILVRDRNKQIEPSQLAFDYKLFKKSQFWLLLGWGVFSMLGYIVLLFSLPAYAISIGLTAQQGSVVGAVLNLGQGLGRPVVGYFSDAAGRINMAGFMTFFCGLVCFVIWIFAKSYGVLIFFAFLVGTVAGTFWTTIAPVGAEVCGLKELPSALSITWLVLVLPTTFSEAIGLKLRQKSGNTYLHAQVFTGFMYVAAAICMLLLRAWKIAEVQERASHNEKTPTALNLGSGQIEREPKSPVIKRLWMWKRV